MDSTVDMDDPFTPGFDAGLDSGTGYGLIHAVDALTLIETDPLLVGPRVAGLIRWTRHARAGYHFDHR